MSRPTRRPAPKTNKMPCGHDMATTSEMPRICRRMSVVVEYRQNTVPLVYCDLHGYCGARVETA